MRGERRDLIFSRPSPLAPLKKKGDPPGSGSPLHGGQGPEHGGVEEQPGEVAVPEMPARSTISRPGGRARDDNLSGWPRPDAAFGGHLVNRRGGSEGRPATRRRASGSRAREKQLQCQSHPPAGQPRFPVDSRFLFRERYGKSAGSRMSRGIVKAEKRICKTCREFL